MKKLKQREREREKRMIELFDFEKNRTLVCVLNANEKKRDKESRRQMIERWSDIPVLDQES